MTDKKRQLERHILTLILIVLTVFIALLISNIHNIQGSARIVNYSGIVRGATQRIVKLEIAGKQNDALIDYIDSVIYGLHTSSQEHNLIYLDDEHFQNNMLLLIDKWRELKLEIYTTREYHWTNTNILSISEEHFEIADKTVSSAESYSQKTVQTIFNLEIAVIITLFALILYLFAQVFNNLKLIRHNKALRKREFIDLHTKLPNKSKCIKLIENTSFITTPTACIVFDINNLKQTNDTLGHSVGDTVIQNFANILRLTIPSKHFVGRNGGDEFIAIIYNTSVEEVEKILENIKKATEKYNRHSTQTSLAYSSGYDISTNYSECTLHTLLHQADKRMYTAKELFYKKATSL